MLNERSLLIKQAFIRNRKSWLYQYIPSPSRTFRRIRPCILGYSNIGVHMWSLCVWKTNGIRKYIKTNDNEHLRTELQTVTWSGPWHIDPSDPLTCKWVNDPFAAQWLINEYLFNGFTINFVVNMMAELFRVFGATISLRESMLTPKNHFSDKIGNIQDMKNR